MRYRAGSVPDEIWGPWRRVLEVDLQSEFAREVWLNGAQFYDHQFGTLVSSIIRLQIATEEELEHHAEGSPRINRASSKGENGR